MTNWFEVDRKGLRNLVAGKPAWHAVAELLQNAWDEASTRVGIVLVKLAGCPFAELIVEDDNPEGFKDIRHAFTLFADTDKRRDPTKRGRFNLGEKLVLARCRWAEIRTTKGTVRFEEDGTRRNGRKKREAGTVFHAHIRMNQQEFDEAIDQLQLLIPPVPTYLNDEQLEARDPFRTFQATLPTVRADEEGVLRRTQRQTEVRLYRVGPDDMAHLFEMGIPVVETGDLYHVDVQQKVPLSMDRDNVTPAYLRKLRALVLNQTHDMLDEGTASGGWVSQALESPDVDQAAVQSVVRERYGDKVVVQDPSDPEATHKAQSRGWAVLHGGAFNSSQWDNLREAGVAEPAGRVFPTRHIEYGGGGDPEKTVDEVDYTPEMRETVELFHRVAVELLGRHIIIDIVNDRRRFGSAGAWYGNGRLRLNLMSLGRKWFKRPLQDRLELLVHELAHDREDNHHSYDYQRECCRLGVKLALAVRDNQLQLYPKEEDR